MTARLPQAGDVIRYRYLWADDAAKGLDPLEARPCVILTVAVARDGKSHVLVLPISHIVHHNNTGLEVPQPVRGAAGLDEVGNFIIVSEGNTFAWPSPEVVSQSGQNAGDPVLGRIPHGFLASIRQGFRKVQNDRALRLIDRDRLGREEVERWRQRQRGRSL